MTDSVFSALDLCLACKGCKAECPSGVDMAKLKYAFQEEYYKTHRRQLRDYVFGYFHVAAGLASAVAPLSNALMEFPAIKNIVARVLGITPHRPFPKFKNHLTLSKATLAPGAHLPRVQVPGSAGESPLSRDEILRSSAAQNDKPKVIFLSDPFARYIEPETEQAALDILMRCGLDVHVLPILGAGASLLSKGFVNAAKDHATRVLDALNQIDPEGEASIVGIEPPEIYTLKHDYVDLLPEREAEVTRRTYRAWLLDEFLLRSAEFDNLRVVTLEQSSSLHDNFSRKIKFHPHCHQRAEGPAADSLPNGTSATVELLRACGYQVELLDTGCCGMAGTFGYEAEHYELSMQVGELKLFPKLREWRIANRKLVDRKSQIANRKSAVVSTGAACRMQIKQGTGLDAEHPIVLVAKALKDYKLS